MPGKNPFGFASRRRAAVGRSSAAGQAHRAVVHQHVAEIPVEAERAVVVLGDFDELGFNVDLRRSNVEHLHGGFDGVEILQGGTHHQRAFAVVEENALGRVEVDAHAS